MLTSKQKELKCGAHVEGGGIESNTNEAGIVESLKLRNGLRVDMYIGMRKDMRIDMCIDMRIAMHIDVRIGMHVDMRIDIRMDMRVDMCIDMRIPIRWPWWSKKVPTRLCTHARHIVADADREAVSDGR